jgi:5'(3')-deoxyribonucleotidase
MRVISIALDCDGVLADFVAGALRLVEEVTGKKFDVSAVTESDFTTTLGLNAHEAHEVKRAIGARRGFAASLPRYPQARQGVRRLSKLGKVFCITTPYESNIWWREERESWLALHFGIDHVHHTNDDDKTSYEADVFVDDKADHVREWLATWPGRTAVLWRTPHNTSELVPRGAHATASWEDLYQIAREVARGHVQQPQQPPMEKP